MNPKEKINEDKVSTLKRLLMGKEFKMLYEKIEKLIDTVEKKPQPQIITQIPESAFSVARSVKVENLPKVPDVQKVHIENPTKLQRVQVENQKEVQKVHITNKEILESEKASAWVPSVIAHTIKGFGDGLVKLWNRGITVKLDDEERLKPLPVIVVDVRGRPVNIGGQTIVAGGFMPGSQTSGGMLPAGSTIGSGRATVTTPGTVVQLSTASTPCRKVIITNLSTNTGIIAVGASNVSAQSGTEIGVALIGSFAREEIEIDNLNKIYIDASVAGEGVTYTYLR